MGTTLIFVGLEVVTDHYKLSNLIGLNWAAAWFQEIAPPYRPYPKPTLVVR